MMAASRRRLGVVPLVCACQIISVSLAAQPATNMSARTEPRTAATRRVTPPALPRTLPPVPAPGSGISLFRELLAMNAGERNRALTNFSPTVRPQILAKVREYESLPPDERELRLRVTELHSYLRPLMTAPTTNRASQLARIPETDRELVEDRLREWDKLSPAVQAELLEHEATLRYLAQIHDRTEEQRRIILTNIPAPRREMLEKGISKWSSMSEDQRRQTLSRFHQFFELTAAEKEKALRTLSGPERRQIEKTLRAFDQLRPDQRAVCLRSLEKFTSLSPAERHRFLKDAERWQQMSPGERQTWRDLVRKMPPPLPTRRPPPPPLPPAARPHRPAPTVATNGS